MASHWFDPRLTVFIIWGIFVVLFICVPSKRFVQRICTLLGCTCCGYDEEITPSNNGEIGVSYEILSNARKQEMDSLRASHLTYRLHPFSLTLEKKHMWRRNSTDIESPNNKSIPQDRIQDPVNDGACGEDAEAGYKRGMDPPERDTEEGNTDRGEKVENSEGETEMEYTHVSVPEPGHNNDCVDMHKRDSPRTEGKKPKEERRKSKVRIFGAKGKEETKDVKEDPDSIELVEKGKRRNCSIFCAICLAEYEAGERVAWSSNPECTHLFHEDCVVQWLVSLGRTKSKMQRFGEDPTEAQLLNYKLECPCCRQEFISRRQAELPEVCGEERV